MLVEASILTALTASYQALYDAAVTAANVLEQKSALASYAALRAFWASQGQSLPPLVVAAP